MALLTGLPAITVRKCVTHGEIAYFAKFPNNGTYFLNNMAPGRPNFLRNMTQGGGRAKNTGNSLCLRWIYAAELNTRGCEENHYLELEYSLLFIYVFQKKDFLPPGSKYFNGDNLGEGNLCSSYLISLLRLCQ